MINKAVKAAKKIKREIIQNIINIRGWRTDRKLVVIESDDWGSIRMPSVEVYEKLLKCGDKVDSDPFTRYDCLESENDLSLLFYILTEFKDCKGNHPVVTANCAVANPDFDKIEASGYMKYYYELFTETFKKYPGHRESFVLYKQGMEKNIFFPQLHCREHMNIRRWLKHLQHDREDTVRAFKNRMISTGDSFTHSNKYAYMDAFNYDSEEELSGLNDAVREGTKLFNNIFGYDSKSFIAPCYIWSSKIEQKLAVAGVEYIQGNKVQLVPKKTEGTKHFGMKRHYIGQSNRYNQTYLVRNCYFEPSWNENKDWVNNCLRDIKIAFDWNKPVTISTHRLNYMGYINEKNRDRNLKLLSLLFSGIIKTWPEVEFITSTRLGEMINVEGELFH